jgi:hypothetical protein
MSEPKLLKLLKEFDPNDELQLSKCLDGQVILDGLYAHILKQEFNEPFKFEGIELNNEVPIKYDRIYTLLGYNVTLIFLDILSDVHHYAPDETDANEEQLEILHEMQDLYSSQDKTVISSISYSNIYKSIREKLGDRLNMLHDDYPLDVTTKYMDLQYIITKD